MKNKLKLFFYSFCVLISASSFGQKNNSGDSCRKTIYYNTLSEKLRLSNSDSAIIYSQKALQTSYFCDEIDLKAQSLLNLSTALDLAGNYPDALKNTFDALNIFQKTQHKKGEAKSLYLIGKIYFHQSECSNDHSKAEYDKESINHYRSALTIEKSLNNLPGIIENQIEIGRVLLSLHQPDSALKILKAALAESEKNTTDLVFIHNTAKSSYNIALIYIDKNNYEIAIPYLVKAASADSVLNNKEGLAVIRIAEMYLRIGNPEKAYQLAQNSLDTALKYGFLLREMQASEILHQALAKKENFKAAYHHLLEYNSMNDSLKNDNTVKALTQMNMQHEFELEQERKEIENQARLDKQKLITYSIVVILALVVLFFIYGIKTYRQKQRDNVILARQRDEIESQRSILETQYLILEEHKKEITDSINYARRIQNALLPSGDYAEKILGEHFILFKPKDIVSGDFYWATKINDWLIVTVADCTGHGVPGAFMSMLFVSFLNEIVRKKEITKASQILDHLRESVIEALKQKGHIGEQKDGMDIVLCVLNTKPEPESGAYLLQFSGANNPLFVVNKNLELTSYPGDKQPVAIYENMKPFTNNEIYITKGDCIFLTTDGYVDQFGGPKSKKFMSKNLKELFIANATKSMPEQGEILDKTFEDWKEGIEQIDDVTVMGLRI